RASINPAIPGVPDLKAIVTPPGFGAPSSHRVSPTLRSRIRIHNLEASDLFSRTSMTALVFDSLSIVVGPPGFLAVMLLVLRAGPCAAAAKESSPLSTGQHPLTF